MPVKVEKYNDELIIKPIGSFDFKLDEEFSAAYKNERTDTRFVVDMGGVTLLDSSALGMLLKLNEYSQGGFYIQYNNTPDSVRDIFDLFRFTDRFHML
ncbi:MAG: STAS domain-containing protein [Magnetococcales bacterium]|nr:STAS domain-containing protein [Magnetococcales bacterium]